MLIITGTQGSGKTTTANYLEKLIDIPRTKTHSLIVGLHTPNINVDQYKTILYNVTSRPMIVEAGLIEAFHIQLLGFPCYTILLEADEDEKLDRLAKRNNAPLELIEEKFKPEFKKLSEVQEILGFDIKLHTNDLQNLDTDKIYNELINLVR